MKERPILFSAPMVRALLDGSKTQTRRVVKGLSDKMWIEESAKGGFNICYDGEPCCGTGVWEVAEHSHPIACPYGAPGDRLWVRETWMADPVRDGTWPHVAFDGCKPRDHSLIPEKYRNAENCLYRAEGHNANLHGWTPAIHMYRWARRIDLEVTGVRVERLQDISDADALAEGVERSNSVGTGVGLVNGSIHCDRYARLWDEINGSGAWAANPFVWVVAFKRVRP